MGAQASSNVSVEENDLVTQSFNNCPKITASNSLDISNVKIDAGKNPNCKGGGDVTFDQSAGVDASCLIKSLQNTTSDSLSKLDAKTQGGLGFQASSNVNDIQNQIQQKLNNDCGHLSATNAAKISDTTITACNFHFVQNATARTSCQINSLQDMANKVSSQLTTDTSGLTLASFLFGNSIGIAIIVAVVLLVLVIVGVVIWAKFRKHGGIKAEVKIGGGFSDLFFAPEKFFQTVYENKFYALFMLLAIVGIVYTIYHIRNNCTSKQITMDDIGQWKDLLMEAEILAELRKPRSVQIIKPENYKKKTRIPYPQAVWTRGQYQYDDACLDQYYQPLL